MNIVIDARVLMDKNYSGVALYTFNLLKNIFSLDKENDYFLFYNSIHKIENNLPDFDCPNVKWIGYSFPNKLLNYVFLKFFHYPSFARLIEKRIEKKIDIFFMPHINFAVLNKKNKNFITIHDLSFLKQPQFFSFRKNFWHKFINVKKLVAKFDKVIAISENTKNDLINFCDLNENKIKVILSAIDSSFKKITPNDEQLNVIKKKYSLSENFILFLGTIEPRKNIESIILAYDDFRNRNRKRTDKLVIAGGNGWKYEEVYNFVAKSVYKDDIIFLGYIDDEDKVYLYNLAEVFVFPSFYEGFGFPPLEAFACEVPVITSFISSLPEITDKAALLIDPYNSKQITLAIEQILFDEELKNDLISRGTEIAKNFSWENTAKKYLEIFK